MKVCVCFNSPLVRSIVFGVNCQNVVDAAIIGEEHDRLYQKALRDQLLTEH